MQYMAKKHITTVRTRGWASTMKEEFKSVTPAQMMGFGGRLKGYEGVKSLKNIPHIEKYQYLALLALM